MLFATPSIYAAPPAFQTTADQEDIRQREVQRMLREHWESTPEVHGDISLKSDIAPPESENLCFPIRDIRLDGKDADQFSWALTPLHRWAKSGNAPCLGKKGIETIVLQVQNTIVARGFVTTHVRVAPQNLTTGILTLTVAPGRVHDIRFSDETSTRARASNALPVRRGDVLNLRDIEQGLENFRQVPKVDVKIDIAPARDESALPGDSDLIIRWRQGFPMRIDVGINDAGSRYTGTYQGYITLAHDNGLTLNDLFYIHLSRGLGGGQSGDKGTRSYTMHYSLPLGYWRIGGMLNGHQHYQSISLRTGTSIRYAGESENAELRLSRVVYRDAVRRLGIHIAGWSRASRYNLAGRELRTQRRRMVGWEAGVTHREFIGQSTVAATLVYRKGTGAFGALPAPEAALGGGTSRSTIWQANVQWSIPFTIAGAKMRYTTLGRIQWNDTPLIPQDRIAIGGRYSVRGFDSDSTLLGSRGGWMRNDLSLTLGLTGQEVYVGIDYGEVDGPSARSLSGRRLMGAVIGLRGGYRGFYWDVFAGRPLHHPDGFRAASTVAGFQFGWAS